ncbi:glutamyl-tRNA(gln) amidotransferase subunit A [Purpureocillium lavendulum]|uniref:Glutamyl-tRNA(Gln) amidotransferase subunit A n=1 Tax=Purpureocillium lavendulum TaxID=1247861 RepID=A0AB34FFB6_9HYPO|nr:glutamyl-tRNA(gln) amidotransferase subunit A [Purpureocillium lavendulum]
MMTDPVKRAYVRTSFLYTISILVTWTPSSINRINGWLQGNSPYPLQVATAALLPLQGLWNFLIFSITSYGTIGQHGAVEQSKRNRWRRTGTGADDEPEMMLYWNLKAGHIG